MSFDWAASGSTLADFGGRQVSLILHKVGMPFFDALRLYGTIDLYVGLREDVFIHDAGTAWEIRARSRQNRLINRDTNAFRQVWAKKKPAPEAHCSQIRASIESGEPLPSDWTRPATKALRGLDAALQSGIRDTAAAEYRTLQGGQTSESTCCVARIPLADGLLAFAGRKRVQAGDILFLPIFEGQIDLSRVVSPLRVRMGVPNVTCAQVLALLALRTSLFAEGYQDRLTAVVFKTDFRRQRSDNYSGVVAIASTAIGQVKRSALAGDLYRVLRGLVGKAWSRVGGTPLVPDALAMASWLMHPLPKHLASFITSQERLRRDEQPQVLLNADYVREVFAMSFGGWQGDHEAVRKLARAVYSGIYHARMKGADEPQKAWYDEVTMLRSAPSPKAFLQRALILIEQGHREHFQVGTGHRGEAYDPSALLRSLGNDRRSFEAFRDLFRMYLVQESTYQAKHQAAEGESPEPSAEDLPDANGEEETE